MQYRRPCSCVAAGFVLSLLSVTRFGLVEVYEASLILSWAYIATKHLITAPRSCFPFLFFVFFFICFPFHFTTSSWNTAQSLHILCQPDGPSGHSPEVHENAQTGLKGLPDLSLSCMPLWQYSRMVGVSEPCITRQFKRPPARRLAKILDPLPRAVHKEMDLPA